jgi:hypothetical protein
MIFISLITVISLASQAQTAMTSARVESIIRTVADPVVGEKGSWQFIFGDRMLICRVDEQQDRVRVMARAADADALTTDELKNCLAANFHATQDVRYALSEKTLWAVYLHPLASLTEEQLKVALEQVYQAATNFGLSYSSSGSAIRFDFSPPEGAPDVIDASEK